MTLQVISIGFGRTGTMSLRMALDQLGFGPCYHMVDVLDHMPQRVPQWTAALDGTPDWDATFKGFSSAVDWPVAAFWQELIEAYPEAKFILSSRSAESWYQSFSQTILAVLLAPDKWPEAQREWLEMVHRVVIGRSLGGATSDSDVIDAFKAHEAAVQAALPADRLLVHQAKDGWESLCAHLGKPVPDTPYPRSNSRQEFFDIMAKGADG